MKVLRTAVFCAVVSCFAAVYASVSATSGYFTVDTAKFAIDDVTSPYFSGAYNSGRKATFLSGVSCQIDFKVSITTPETRQLSHLLVNETKVNSTKEFTWNVGGMRPGERLEVIAVDKNGNKTDPFVVNMDIASKPPFWSNGETLHTSFDKNVGVVTYYSPNFAPLQICDGISDGFDMAGVECPVKLFPTIKVMSAYATDSAQLMICTESGLHSQVAEIPWFKNKTLFKQKLGQFASVDLTGCITGAFIEEWNPQIKRWNITGGDLGIAYGCEGTAISFRIPQTLNIVYCKLGFTSNGRLVLRMDNGNLSGVADFNPLIGLVGKIGAGVEGCCVEGSASGGFNLGLSLPGNPKIITGYGFTIVIGGRYSFLIWEDNIDAWRFSWPRQYSRNAESTQSRGLLSSAETGPRVISRDYSKRTIRTLKARGLLASSGDDSLGDGYPYPMPSLAVGDDKDMLVYIRDNEGRGDINRTEVVCRLGSHDDWSEPNTIWDDGTADFMPSIAQGSDGTTVVAWANAKCVHDDNSSFGEFVANMEIAVGVRNSDTGVWNCKNLTDDTALDIVPKVKVAANGTAAVAWMSNASGRMVGDAECPSSIKISFLRDGEWTAPMTIAENVGTIYSFNLAYDGAKATVVWDKDKDGISDTTGDGEVWCAVISNGKVASTKRISGKDTDAMRPFVWYVGNKLRVIWMQDGELFVSTNLGAGTKLSTDEKVAPDYNLLPGADGRALIVWQKQNETNPLDSGTVALLYTSEGVVSKLAATLFETSDRVNRNITGGIADDGSIRLAYESVEVAENEDGGVNYGAVSLKTLWREPSVDVGFAQGAIAFSEEATVGSTVNVLATVSNFDTTAVKGVEVKVWRGAEGSSNRKLLGTAVVDIAALSSVTVSFPWTVEQGLDEVAFVAEVDPESRLSDTDQSNNTQKWNPDFEVDALSLRNATCTKINDSQRRITASVCNDGIVTFPAGATVRFWRGEVGGTLLTSTTLGSIVSGADGAQQVSCVWNLSSIPMTSAVERVTIELDGGDIRSSVAVDVEGAVWNLIFDPQGGLMTESTAKVLKGQQVGDLPVPTKSGQRFVGWYTMPDAGEEVTRTTIVTADYTLYAHWENFVCRMSTVAAEGYENDIVSIGILGGNDHEASSVKMFIAYNTATAADLDLANGMVDGIIPKGGLKFPLTLVWEAGEIGEKVVSIPLKKESTLEPDEFFTIQIGEPRVMTLGADTVCTVVVKDQAYEDLATKIAGGIATDEELAAWEKVQKARAPYIRGVTTLSDAGKVTGSGLCAEGKKVTLKATANKGFVFVGWYDGMGAQVATTATLVVDRTSKPAASSAISTTLTDVSENATYYAKFISIDEDKDSIMLTLNGDALSGPSSRATALETNVTCGVALEWPLASYALSATTVKVAGLPAGLKFDAKSNTICGAPTAASKVDAKKGVVPSDVKITVTTAGKSSVTYIVKLTVDPLPAWAVGTFDGEVESGGIVQAFTVATSGKISGKVLEGGKTWALSAPNFSRAEYAEGGPEPEVPSPSFFATVIGKAGKEVVTNEVEVAGAVVKGVEVGVASSYGWSAWQNLWSRPDTKAEMPVFKKSFDVTLESGLKLTFKKNGAVSFAGKIAGSAVSGSSQLVFADDGNWHVTLYAPPKGSFPGWCATISVALVVDGQNVVIDVDLDP